VPDSPETKQGAFDLGRGLAARNDIAAESYLRDAASHDARHRPLALLLLASLLSGHGRFAEAVRFARKGLAIAPHLPALHNTLALALLAQGDYEAGWREYEWRRHVPGFAALPDEGWQGERLEGVLLVQTEQGMGDSLMLARYLPMAAARARAVVLTCQAPLIPLLRRMPGVAAAMPTGDPLPWHDRAVFMASLPRLFETRLDNIPSSAGYLAADPARARAWSGLLPGRRRIGLVWAGNPELAGDEQRSMPFDVVEPLLAAPHVQFFGLQVGERARDIAGRSDIVDLSAHLTDFAETAAVIANMDLVIAVDTAVAHLAGALGRPSWIMLPRVADWRWLIRRTDSPWYASVRLFRQTRPDDWQPVIRRVASALRRFSGP
jgi:Glycosyltransferase family 9 (heptosyltransferase)